MRQKIELMITVLLLAGLIFASRKVSRYAASDNVKDVAGNKVVVDAGHGVLIPERSELMDWKKRK